LAARRARGDRTGADGLIFITEAWETVVSPGAPVLVRPSEDPARTEVSAITAVTADGREKHWKVPFKRLWRRVRFGETQTSDAAASFYLEPVRAVWAGRKGGNASG